LTEKQTDKYLNQDEFGYFFPLPHAWR